MEGSAMYSVNKDQLKLAKVKEKLRGVYRRRDPVRTHDSRRGRKEGVRCALWMKLADENIPVSCWFRRGIVMETARCAGTMTIHKG
jgi:hypothetical protein